jgi:hypothetical protein
MPPQNARRRMRSGAVRLSAVSVLSLTLVSCSSSTSASCVDGQNSRGGSHRVVPDYYCDNGGSYGRYYWYYGGRTHGGYISRGSTIRPRGSKITSRGGRVISRGGFGGHSGSHGG